MKPLKLGLTTWFHFVYIIYGFIICLVSTLVAGVLAAILPNNIAGILTAIPYLIAIIFVLFKFLKQQRRAPTATEKRNSLWCLV